MTYIAHTYSEFGMGSDSEAWLLDNGNIDEALRAFGRTREDMLSKRTTYAPANDLVEIPDNLVIGEKEDVFEDAAFCVWNRWHFHHLVFCGRAVFRRKYLDFRDHEGVGRAKGGLVHEFAWFSMERVLERHWDEDIEYVCAVLHDRYERGRRKLWLDDDWGRRMKRRQEAWDAEYAATLEKMVNMEACGQDVLGNPVVDEGGFYAKVFREEIIPEERGKGMECAAYKYPLCVGMIGAVYEHHKEATSYYTCGEVFGKGADARLVAPCLIRSSKGMYGFKGLPVQGIIRLVFGYD